jgi:hypothetical protein
MYPWPTGDFDNAMDVALDTAMNYLERTGQAQNFVEVQRRTFGRYCRRNSDPPPAPSQKDGNGRGEMELASLAPRPPHEHRRR